jgi:hypothetical protein
MVGNWTQFHYNDYTVLLKKLPGSERKAMKLQKRYENERRFRQDDPYSVSETMEIVLSLLVPAEPHQTGRNSGRRNKRTEN